MSLIKSAQIISSLSESDKEFYTNLQQTLKLSSIVESVETFSTQITPHSYEEWLRQIGLHGEEMGVDLTNRERFEDIAFDVLDNDGEMPAYGDDEITKRHLVDTLWHAYNTNTSHAQVNSHLDTRSEDEEATSKTDGKVAKHVDFLSTVLSNPSLKNVYTAGIGRGKDALKNADQKPEKCPYLKGTIRAKAWKLGYDHGFAK